MIPTSHRSKNAAKMSFRDSKGQKLYRLQVFLPSTKKVIDAAQPNQTLLGGKLEELQYSWIDYRESQFKYIMEENDDDIVTLDFYILVVEATEEHGNTIDVYDEVLHPGTQVLENLQRQGQYC